MAWGALRDHVKDGMPLHAAALAFFTLLAAVPLFALAVLAAGEGARGWLFSGTDALLGPDQGEALKTLIAEGAPEGGTGYRVVGTLALFLFAASRVFATLETALNRIWDVEPAPERALWRLARKRFLSFAMVLGVALLMLMSLAGGALAAALVPAWAAARLLLGGLFAFFVLALAYKFLPDARTDWRDVLPPAAFIAALFSAGERALGALAASGPLDTAYGSLAAVIVAMLWFYYTSSLLLYGAELAQESARERGATPEPEHHARSKGQKEDATPRRPSGDASTRAESTRGTRRRARGG